MRLAGSDPVPALTWWIRLKPVDDPSLVVGFGDRPAQVAWGMGEVFDVLLDPSILAMPPDQRPPRYLDWLHGNLLQLAEARGWPTAGFEQAHSGCVEDGLLLAWQGPAKTSANRRLKAVPGYRFDQNGDCWATVTVSVPSGDPIAVGGPWDCYPEFGYFKKSARSIRWLSSSTVHIATWPPDLARAWKVDADHTLNLPDYAAPALVRARWVADWVPAFPLCPV